MDLITNKNYIRGCKENALWPVTYFHKFVLTSIRVPEEKRGKRPDRGSEDALR